MDVYAQHLDAHALSAYKLVHPHVVGLVVVAVWVESHLHYDPCPMHPRQPWLTNLVKSSGRIFLCFYVSWVNYHRDMPSFPDEGLTIGRLHTVTLSYNEARRSVAACAIPNTFYRPCYLQ